MRNFKRKITALLTALCCLAGAMVPAAVHAADASGEADAIPRVTFTNVQNDSPDLFVTKYVESASEEYPAPADAEFTFTLRLDGALVNRLEYRLFDSGGAEIFNYADGPSTEDKSGKTAFRTDRSGVFTLKAGQTAKFEYIGTGTSYEVYEISQPDKFIQIQPASGQPVLGTMVPTGARAEFTNLYSDGGGGGSSTELKITKAVAFPSGYESPETPDFVFRVEIDGKPWTLEDYTVVNTETGLSVGSGTTDASGQFTLRGGCTASFTGIPVGVDYVVTEILTDENGEILEGLEGWRSSGVSNAGGVTVSPAVSAIFHNVSASFAVSKQMEDGSKPETDFTFELTKADRSVWAGAEYYLYTTGGVLADEELHSTDASGRFTLRPGQTAVFIGIPAGTIYNVREIGDPDYIQVVPSSSAGYQDKSVSDSVELLPFVNKEVKTYGLNVTKLVENGEGQSAFAQDTFTFILKKKTEPAGDDDGSYEVVSDAVYSIETGTSQYTYRTDDEGRFTIKANETARFTGLSPGTYRVEEVDLTLEYAPKPLDTEPDDSGTQVVTDSGTGITVTVNAGEKIYTQEGMLDASTLNFTFTNLFSPKNLDLYLVKADRSGKSLAGAKFVLYRDEALTNPVEQSGESEFTTDSDGKITLTDIQPGVYYLKETQSPEGYQLLANPIKIEVIRSGDTVNVTVDGKTWPTYDAGNADTHNDQIYIQQRADKNDELHLTVYNSKGFTLPLTGGAGNVVWIVLAGLAGAFLLTAVTLRRRRKGA